MAAFNLPSLLAKLCVGRYFGSSFLLEAFLNSCSFELSLGYQVCPNPCPFCSLRSPAGEDEVNGQYVAVTMCNTKVSWLCSYCFLIRRLWVSQSGSLFLQDLPQHFQLHFLLSWKMDAMHAPMHVRQCCVELSPCVPHRMLAGSQISKWL